MNSPLFDNRLTTRNLERAYEAMWELREMGLSPRHIGNNYTNQGAAELPFRYGADVSNTKKRQAGFSSTITPSPSNIATNCTLKIPSLPSRPTDISKLLTLPKAPYHLYSSILVVAKELVRPKKRVWEGYLWRTGQQGHWERWPRRA